MWVVSSEEGRGGSQDDRKGNIMESTVQGTSIIETTNKSFEVVETVNIVKELLEFGNESIYLEFTFPDGCKLYLKKSAIEAYYSND